MKKMICPALITVLVFCFAFTGCSGNGTEAATETGDAAASGTQKTPYASFKVGTSHNKTSFFYEGLAIFKELVEKDTNGGVTVELYDSAALGSEGEMAEGVSMGTVDACLVGSSSVAKLQSSFNVFSLPYLFDSNQHVDAVFDSEIGDQFKDLLLDKNGVVMLDYWDSGFRHYVNSKKPINSPEDMKGLLIRIPDNPIQAATLKALGASSSTLSFNEVYMACANGTVDGQEGPVFAMVDENMYEVQDYMVLDGHIYTVMGLLMNANTFNKFTAEDQAVIKDAAHKAGLYEKELIRNNETENIKFLKEQGMEINENPDKDAWRAATESVYDQFYDTYGKDLIESIRDFKY